jgi:hypothetical protein
LANFVVIRDRGGNDLAHFEGYYFPDWLPDGRLLMLGLPCRSAVRLDATHACLWRGARS